MAENIEGLRHCAFCGRSEMEVRLLIPAKDGKTYICDNCIDVCADFLEENFEVETEHDSELDIETLTLETLPRPKEIRALLDEHVIGQDDAKLALSVAVYNHYKRILSLDEKNKGDAPDDGVEIQKSNVLLLGPTGVGKTYIAQTLAQSFKVPFAIADATTLTEAGYVGEDVENILLRLIQAADFDVERAEKGIIYIDEIDKISRKGENRSITRDVSGEGTYSVTLDEIMDYCRRKWGEYADHFFEGVASNIGYSDYEIDEYLGRDTDVEFDVSDDELADMLDDEYNVE